MLYVLSRFVPLYIHTCTVTNLLSIDVMCGKEKTLTAKKESKSDKKKKMRGDPPGLSLPYLSTLSDYEF